MRTLYRLLLRLLPREFDTTDRAEMLAHHDARVERSGRDRGRTAALLTRLLEVFDLVRTLLRVRRTGRLDGLGQDVRIGVRGLRRNPAVTVFAVASLALGIGATTAVFSALDVWIIRPLPVPESERVVSVAMSNREEGWARNPFTPRDFLDWREAASSVDLVAYRSGSAGLDLGDRTERVSVVHGSADLFEVIGYEFLLGRGFAPDEERSEGPRVVVLSEDFWEAALAADRSVLGRTVEVSGVPHIVVGVLEDQAPIPGLEGDVWLPLRFSPDSPRSGHSLSVVGRMAEGTSLNDVRDELNGVARRVAESDPERTFPDASVLPLRDVVYGAMFEQGGLVLGASVFFVLLIACANISNLLLARGMGRTQELALRSALGAGRGRIARQLFIESVVLAVLGGLAGVGLGWLGVEALLTWVFPPDVPGWEQITLDGRALSAAAALSVFSVLLFGIAPALRGSKVDLRSRLMDGRSTTASGKRQRLSRALVAGEIALALVLLVSAGLLIESLVRLHGTEMGFRTDDRISIRLYVPPSAREDAAGVVRFHEEALERIDALPGVTTVAAATGPPVGGWSTFLYSEAGDGSASSKGRRSAENRVVTPDYFDVMGIRLLAGRGFSEETDLRGAPSVTVVSRALAETDWGSVSGALGRRLEVDGEESVIVGVAEAGRLRGPHRPPPPVVFRSLDQHHARGLFYVIETDRRLAPLLQDVRAAVRAVDGSVAVWDATTLDATVGELLEAERAALGVLGALAAIALLLTLVGVYGVVAHSVGRRRREMGLRMALGARAGGLVRMVLAQNGRLAAGALFVGAGVSVPVGRVLASALGGVEPSHPGVLTAGCGLLFGAVLLSAYLPARRATRVDPVESFRAG